MAPGGQRKLHSPSAAHKLLNILILGSKACELQSDIIFGKHLLDNIRKLSPSHQTRATIVL